MTNAVAFFELPDLFFSRSKNQDKKVDLVYQSGIVVGHAVSPKTTEKYLDMDDDVIAHQAPRSGRGLNRCRNIIKGRIQSFEV